MHRSLAGPLLAFLILSTSIAGTVSAAGFDAPGHPIANGLYWADEVVALVRGPLDVANPGLGVASAGTAADALGPATGVSTDTVSLGDGGSITVSFAQPLFDGQGDDFAVFENGFLSVDGLFGELGFVEVSSNGTDFARFESATLNATPVLAFGTFEPTDYAGLAGDQPAGLGTGFDLAELASHPLVVGGQVDLAAVRYVRIVDVIGDGSTTDGGGLPIYDPYATPFSVGGFDVDGVAALQVPAVPIAPFALVLGGLALLGAARRELCRRTLRSGGIALAVFALDSPATALTATFDDAAALLGLGPESFYDGSDLAGGFASGGATFTNEYEPTFGSWRGFSVSNTTDTTTPGFTNQYSAFPGGGALGSAAYGVSFSFEPSTVLFPTPVDLQDTWIANTTYAYLAMRDGDAFTDPFGGPSGDEPDLLVLSIEGFDAGAASVGIVDFILSDYTSPPPNAGDYIVDAWTQVDLSSLENVSELRFSLTSTDSFIPSYFAIDELRFEAVNVPEPGAGALLLVGLCGLGLMAGRRRARR